MDYRLDNFNIQVKAHTMTLYNSFEATTVCGPDGYEHESQT